MSRKSIDDLLEASAPYEISPTKERKPIEDWYSLNEITERYPLL